MVQSPDLLITNPLIQFNRLFRSNWGSSLLTVSTSHQKGFTLHCRPIFVINPRCTDELPHLAKPKILKKTSESAFAPQFTLFHAPFPKAEFFVIPPSRQCFWTETHSPQAYLCAWEDGEILYLFPGRSNNRLLLLGGFQTYFTFPQSCILIFIEVGSGSHVHICVVLVIRNNVLFLSRHVLLTACSIYLAALLLLLFWCCRYVSEFQYRPQGSSWSGGKVEWRW